MQHSTAGAGGIGCAKFQPIGVDHMRAVAEYLDQGRIFLPQIGDEFIVAQGPRRDQGAFGIEKRPRAPIAYQHHLIPGECDVAFGPRVAQ